MNKERKQQIYDKIKNDFVRLKDFTAKEQEYLKRKILDKIITIGIKDYLEITDENYKLDLNLLKENKKYKTKNFKKFFFVRFLVREKSKIAIGCKLNGKQVINKYEYKFEGKAEEQLHNEINSLIRVYYADYVKGEEFVVRFVGHYAQKNKYTQKYRGISIPRRQNFSSTKRAS